jgi:tetratricopeptide (TPR) repeat protein
MHANAETLLAEFRAHAARAGEDAALTSLVHHLREPLAAPDVWAAVIAGALRGAFATTANQIVDHALHFFPHHPQVRYWHGNVLRVGLRGSEAEQAFRLLLREHPTHREAALSLAFLLREQGRTNAAAQVLFDSTRTRNGDVTECLATLSFLRECAAFGAARELASAARARWPQNADIAALAGEFALALGQFDAARENLRIALDLNPRKGASWLRLSHCQRYTDGDEADIQRFEEARHNTVLDSSTRACVGFALGKAQDDLADYGSAATVLREANALARAGSGWSNDSWNAFVDWQMSASTAHLGDNRDFEPVFVVGLPRTGTTLAATLLARDPQLRDRGELNWIGAMHDHLAAQDAMHDAEALRIAADLISNQMRRDDAPARWYLDKNPLNFRYLGLIAALFPRAKIIHCRRDPHDTALSLWMQHFDHADSGFAYDFADIAAYARGYERLMTHWRSTVTLPIFDLDYEALVSDTTPTLHRLAQFLGADAMAISSPTPMSSTAITTASVWQARQPLYQSSVARWRRYAPFLPELTAHFG